MNNLLAIAAQNTIVAAILSILVLGLTRFWRRPPVAHILWLLVLAKLIGPPVLPVDVTGRFASRPAIEPRGVGPDLVQETSFPDAYPGPAAASLHGPVSDDGETSELFIDDKGNSNAPSSLSA
jgi:hypothetical protein